MSQTYIGFQFEKLSKRFDEVNILLKLAHQNQNNEKTYIALCRSAHILLISHFEGLYKDICKDVIADINSKLKFSDIRKDIFNTYCNYFIQKEEFPSAAHIIRQRLKEAFETYNAHLKYEPFLFVNNKNPAPDILESILNKFGTQDFFWSLESSDLDLVFANQKSDTIQLRNRIARYTRRNVENYPYTVSKHYYHPIQKNSKKRMPHFGKNF